MSLGFSLFQGGIRAALLVVGILAQTQFASASVESELAFHKGVAAYGEDRLDDARSNFEIVIDTNPDDASALQYLSLIALAQGQNDEAVEFAARAHEADPENLEIRIDLGIALLSAARLSEAATELDAVLALDPGNAQAEMYRGIVDYRRADYAAAIRHFETAQEADPELTLQARYYTALAEASLGNVSASAGAFSDVLEQSPAHPLGRSAKSLRDGMPDEPRIWSIYGTTGVEFDTNPTVVGDESFGDFQKSEDVAGIFRAGGQIMAFEQDGARVRVGYDGYVSVYADESSVSQQTHVGWASAVVDRDPVQVGLRYDFAYTALDLTDRFRLLHRVTPSVSLRSDKWGVTRFAYELQFYDFDDNNPDDSLDRSGPQHSIGIDQFFLLPEPFVFAQLGGRLTKHVSDGSEFDFQGFELIVGGGIALPFESDFRVQYRFHYRDYEGQSLADPASPESRTDEVHRLNVDLVIPVHEIVNLSIAGSFSFSDSTVSFYEYDRQIVGTYLTFHF